MIQLKDASIAEPSKHVDFIDGLRGIAVLMVIFFHSSVHTHMPYTYEATPRYAGFFSSGVTLFFVLSAYTLFLASNARNETGLRSSLRFYARRMFRILPLWWAVCLFYALFMTRTFADAALSMSFAVGFLKDSYLRCVSPVGWTLFVEEAFYLFFPIWISLITSTWRAALALAILYFTRTYYVPEWSADPNFQPGFIMLTLSNYFVFFIGILVWFISREPKFQTATDKLWVRRILDLTAIACLAAVFATTWDQRAFVWGILLLIATVEGTATRRLLSNRFLTLTGGLCYGIYLLHHVVEHFFTQAAQYQLRGRVNGEVEMIFAFVLTTVVTTALAWLVFTYFEKPIVRRGRRWIASFAGVT